MSGLTLATCDLELKPGAAPDWVHLFPPGHIEARDGRSFELADPGAVILAFEAAGLDLPIDYEHQNDTPDAKLKGPIPAAGWIKELDARDDGIWGRVDWTATARALITERAYRYLSPSFLVHPKTMEITKLKGAGLVHNPAFQLTALASQEDTMPAEPVTLAEIATALGLDRQAEGTAILDAIRALLDARAKGETAREAPPNPAKYVPIAALRDLLEERNSETAQAREERARDKVDRAFKQGYLSGGVKARALELAQQDEARFDTFIASTAPMFAHLTKPSHANGPAPRTDTGLADDPNAAAICAQLGLKPGALA